jgi:hypothetical protein
MIEFAAGGSAVAGESAWGAVPGLSPRSVSPCRSPNRTCEFPRIRLSTVSVVRRLVQQPRGWGSRCPGSDTDESGSWWG